MKTSLVIIPLFCIAFTFCYKQKPEIQIYEVNYSDTTYNNNLPKPTLVKFYRIVNVEKNDTSAIINKKMDSIVNTIKLNANMNFFSRIVIWFLKDDESLRTMIPNGITDTNNPYSDEHVVISEYSISEKGLIKREE